MPASPSTPVRAAVYLSGGIGDVLLNLGFVRALADHHRHPVTLVLATPPVTTGLLLAQDYIDRVVTVPALPHDKAARVAAMHELLEPLAIDALFLVGFQTHVLRAAVRAGIAQRIGYVRLHRFYQARHMTRSIFVRRRGTPHPDTHTWLPRLFAKYGYPPLPAGPSLVPNDASVALAAPWAAGHARLVGLGLGAAAARRRYGAAPWAEVMQTLARHDPSTSFLLFGGSDVTELAAEIRARAGALRVIDVTAANLDLQIGQALVSRCVAFAGNDSMGIHLAVASGVPTIGLFGVSPPMAYSPLLTPLVAEGGAGMDGIAPTRVASALLRLLATRA